MRPYCGRVVVDERGRGDVDARSWNVVWMSEAADARHTHMTALSGGSFGTSCSQRVGSRQKPQQQNTGYFGVHVETTVPGT